MIFVPHWSGQRESWQIMWIPTTKAISRVNHIEQNHGLEICHRYLCNECTTRRCLFTNKRPNVSSAQITEPAPTLTVFHSPPTTRPVAWSQAVAQEPVPRLKVEIENVQVHVIRWCTVLKYDYHTLTKISVLCTSFLTWIVKKSISMSVLIHDNF